MSYATVERDIEQRLTDNWATTVIDINPNVDFTPPAHETSWIKLRIMNEDVNRKNIGNPGVHRVDGTIVINIYTALNEGSRTGMAHGDTLAALFRDKQFNGITCREATVKAAGQFEGRWQTNVLIPFYWDGYYTA